jgi:hypothetical protein
MAKDSQTRFDWEGTARGLDPDSLDSIERVTEKKVTNTIFALSIALEAWEKAKKRPPALKKSIEKIRWFYSALRSCEKRFLSKASGMDAIQRMKRIGYFYDICREYEAM